MASAGRAKEIKRRVGNGGQNATAFSTEEPASAQFNAQPHSPLLSSNLQLKQPPQPPPSRRVMVPAEPPHWRYSVRLLVGVTIASLYFLGLCTTVPGMMGFLRSTPVGLGLDFANTYEPVMIGLQGSHETAPLQTQQTLSASSAPLNNDTLGAPPPSHQPAYIPSLGLVHDPTYDWSGLWKRWSLPSTAASAAPVSSSSSLDPETGSAYILPNFIDRVVPFFLISIVVEFFVARAQVERKREKLLAQKIAAVADLSRTPAVVDVTPFDVRDTEPYFRLNDSLNSISLGMLQQMLHVGGFVRPLIYAPYIWVYEQYAIIRLPITWWSWLLCFVLVELGYYWYHRFGHEMNVLWAAHIAHHSSEEYNLTTALRQGAVQYSASWIFNLPAAFLIPPPLFSFHQHLNRIYQFFIHTRTVGRLHPAIEYVFNTPSHHRAHHGSNPHLIDKNYGGTLILFDRLFGTFVDEDEARAQHGGEPVVYGLTHNVRSWNPLWCNWHHWQYMWRCTSHMGWSWRRLEVLWQRPGWNPAHRDDASFPIPSAIPLRPVYDRQAVRGVAGVAYLLLTFFSTVVVLKLLVVACSAGDAAAAAGGTAAAYWQAWGLCAVVVANATLLGGLMEGRWSWPVLQTLDLTRWALVAALALSVRSNIEARLVTTAAWWNGVHSTTMMHAPPVSLDALLVAIGTLLLPWSVHVCRNAAREGAVLDHAKRKTPSAAAAAGKDVATAPAQT